MPKITQEMLAAYYQLAIQERQLKEERLVLREKILKMFREGCPTQPGKYKPIVTECQARAFTHANVLHVLGEDEFEWLLGQIEPVKRVSFRVIQS